jgi:MFS transporter, FSR family, fosmidomycin resistance protein
VSDAHITGLVSARPAKTRALGSACLAHILHDGYSDLLYLLFPIWQSEFALSYGLIGVMKGGFSGALSLFQIPAAALAARFGERSILVGGTVLIALTVLLYGAANSIFGLGALLLIAGLAASVQHPLSSSLVASAFGGSRSALGFYNFAGDAGKVLAPSMAALLIWAADWRIAVVVLGGAGVALGMALYWLIPNPDAARQPETNAPGPDGSAKERLKPGFACLTAIGICDYATRTGFLTFMPLLLSQKGASPAHIGTALSLIFVGGAAGKFACGVLAERLGVIRTVIATEAITAASIAALLALPLGAAFALLMPLGVALNGTSSVLYGSVAELAPEKRLANAFAIFYTATLGAGAVAPACFGVLGDWAGLEKALVCVAVLPALTIPLAVYLKAQIEPAPRAGERSLG